MLRCKMQGHWGEIQESTRPQQQELKRRKRANEHRKGKLRIERWTQSNLNNSEWEAGAEESFSNAIRTKDMNMTQILFLNIGSIRLVNDNPKNQEVRAFIRYNVVDTLGMVDTNVNWTNARNRN